MNLLHSVSISKKSVLDLIRNDSDLVTLTGISSMDKLLKLVSIGEYIIQSLNYNVNFYIDILHRLVLTLMKLKLNTSYKCLAVLFGISKSTCSNYFYETIDLLFLILKPAIVWPLRSSINKNITKCFITFASTRLVVDATETSIEIPKCLSCRIRTYSYYKGKHTIKFLVGISPDGIITFVIDVYGGKASDKHIFIESGILNKCECNDAIMVDKGFLIEEECSRAGVKLFHPPFLKKNKQLSFEDGTNNTQIARARVHIERAIQRMKIFHVLKNNMPWKCMCKVDKIINIICGIVNISNPIIGMSGF